MNKIIYEMTKEEFERKTILNEYSTIKKLINRAANEGLNYVYIRKCTNENVNRLLDEGYKVFKNVSFALHEEDKKYKLTWCNNEEIQERF